MTASTVQSHVFNFDELCMARNNSNFLSTSVITYKSCWYHNSINEKGWADKAEAPWSAQHPPAGVCTASYRQLFRSGPCGGWHLFHCLYSLFMAHCSLPCAAVTGCSWAGWAMGQHHQAQGTDVCAIVGDWGGPLLGRSCQRGPSGRNCALGRSRIMGSPEGQLPASVSNNLQLEKL